MVASKLEGIFNTHSRSLVPVLYPRRSRITLAVSNSKAFDLLDHSFLLACGSPLPAVRFFCVLV